MNQRPPARWHHSTTHLDRFAIVTWAVDPDALDHVLPFRLKPDVREVDGLGEVAFVSVVPFLDRRFHFRFAPWPWASCGQVNHRAYVRHRDGRTGVWFFGTSLDTPLVVVPQRLWAMPWHRERVRIAVDDDAYEAEVDGDWGGLRLRLRRTGRPLGVPPGYRDAADASANVLDPELGWFGRTRGTETVGRYSVWHEPLRLEACTVEQADVDNLTRLSLVPAGTPPLWAGIQATTRFDVHTPPVIDVDR